MVSEPARKSPSKRMVPVVSYRVTESASTVDWKVVLPELATSTEPMSTAPVTVTLPLRVKVTWAVEPPVIPPTERAVEPP